MSVPRLKSFRLLFSAANSEILQDGAVTVTKTGIPSKSVSLDRRSTFLSSSIFIVGFCSSEIIKQVGNFWLTTSYGNQYPIPPPLLIVLVESLKFFIVSLYLLVSCTKYGATFLGFSAKFIAPASCYFITNLLYLHALTITSPPIWVVLIQTRILYTAAIYKVVFGKSVTVLQVIGCILIVCSIFGTRLSEMQARHLTIGLGLLLVSQLSAAISSIASVTIEVFLKNDTRSFSEQQFWLYFWGAVLGIISLITTSQSVNIFDVLRDVISSSHKTTLLLFAVVSSALAGLCVPCIVKNLDSIVKDYVAAFNNLLLAIITAWIFSEYFQINSMYGVSLIILLMGVLFYERKTFQSL